jgi:Sec-independent protein translocase protein TatA
MFCTECGKEVPGGSEFCTNCGARMAEAKPPGPPLTPPIVQAAKPKSNKTLLAIVLGIIGALVAVAIVLVLVLVVFKGDDTGKAKEFMKKADAALKKVEKQAEDVSSSLSDLGNEMQAGNIASSQAYNASADKIKSDISDIKDEAETAKGEYEDIKGLGEGVQDYKEYADLRIEEIDNGLELLGLEEEFIDYTGSFLSSIEAGTQVNTDEYMSKLQEYVEDLTALGTKLSTASEKADALKEDKNL